MPVIEEGVLTIEIVCFGSEAAIRGKIQGNIAPWLLCANSSRSGIEDSEKSGH
jgi:hypothetical protein